MASQNGRVLIVDNNEEEARIFASMLERAGYHPRTTWSGLEALELLKSGEFAILLVSNYLPTKAAVLDRDRGEPVPYHHAAETTKYDRRRKPSTKLTPAVFISAGW